ncbi:hypothetical protein EPA93_19535 [Ktedonosporobacter rubrisoli]|uniref:HAMP domain-containing protein n=1 Tax=Ktedonosporobacter rubrisoli TaxID=2509675 RepID=A0A4P6JRH7_KTERU|nr:hypothetical protein [Ktedonosporobacter rubrisoli]QBD78068.1 hypothetical protein EPA93_19535 [Ktedonosporobacter rubrisoli]
MEISLRLDTLGMVELRYLRGRERYREWPQFRLLAASRQAQVMAYFNHDVAEQLHQQILMVEAAVGLDADDEEEEGEDERVINGDESEGEESTPAAERESTSFSPAFAQALKQLNELARQRLPDGNSGGSSQASGEFSADIETDSEEEDALEQLQDAFVQMMEVVRELAEEMSTDALKITGRFKCARTNIKFIPRTADEEDEDEDQETMEVDTEDGMLDIEVELVMVLQLFEEGRARPDDPPAVELQLDVDDFERLHETLDVALERERRSRRRR